MVTLHVEHRVRDYNTWKEQGFDRDPVGRARGGVRRHRILRDADDPNYVVIQLDFDDVATAQAFRESLYDLWGRVGSGLGLDGPQARVLEPADSGEY